MDIREYRMLLSERVALKNVIDLAPKSGVITRKSFEARLRKVEEKLKAYERDAQRVPSA